MWGQFSEQALRCLGIPPSPLCRWGPGARWGPSARVRSSSGGRAPTGRPRAIAAAPPGRTPVGMSSWKGQVLTEHTIECHPEKARLSDGGSWGSRFRVPITARLRAGCGGVVLCPHGPTWDSGPLLRRRARPVGSVMRASESLPPFQGAGGVHSVFGRGLAIISSLAVLTFELMPQSNRGSRSAPERRHSRAAHSAPSCAGFAPATRI